MPRPRSLPKSFYNENFKSLAKKQTHQDRMGGSFGAGFLTGSVGSYFGSSGKSGNTNEMIGKLMIPYLLSVQ
jgi:hypothetical protein